MLKSLEHVNIRTQQLAEQKRFYCEVLGLVEGPRPNFSFAGSWIYCGDKPVVHLVAASEQSVVSPTPNDSLEHFAFAGEDLQAFIQRLKSHGVPFRIGKIVDFRVCQVNVHDRDGNHIHVDFPLEEAEALAL